MNIFTKRILVSFISISIFLAMGVDCIDLEQEGGFENSIISSESLESSFSESSNESENLINESESEEGSQTPIEELNPTKIPLVVKPTSTPTLTPTTEIKGDEEISVHFIDVGQGDAILIKSSDISILIDGGDRGTTVLNYLKANNVKELDLAVGTHPHADHIGGLINVMQEISVKEVLDPGIAHTTKTFEDYLNVIDEKNIKFTEARVGKSYKFNNGISLEVLHPQNPSSSHLNDASIVIRMVYGDVSFIFAGDSKQPSETQILNRSNSIKSTILKVGHHGSSTSTSQSFLNDVAPKVAIIMCGKDNRYGHPHSETIDKLNAAKIETYRTDLHGTIILNTNGKTYSIKTNNVVSIAPVATVTPKPTSAPVATVTPKPTATNSPKTAPVVLININTASFEALQEIIHIGPERAQQIIDLRPFSSLDDITRVSGIGPARLKDIKDEGKAYVG